MISSLTRFSIEPNSLSLDPSWLALSSTWSWPFLTRTQGLDPPLDSDTISIWTCFLNLLLKFTRTTYPSSLHPIGLPDVTWSAYLNLSRTTYLIYIWAPYPSLTRSHPCLPALICPYPAESPYPILLLIGLLLTQPNYLTRSFPDKTYAYPIVPDHHTRLPCLTG
jgi:hypothetical protein